MFLKCLGNSAKVQSLTKWVHQLGCDGIKADRSSKSLAGMSELHGISSASGHYFFGCAILMVYFGHPHLCHDAIASLFAEARLIACMHLLLCLISRM